MDSVYAATGVAFIGALIPYGIAHLIEELFSGVFSRKRRVFGFAWTFSALGIAVAGCLKEIVLLAKTDSGSLLGAVGLFIFSIVLIGVCIWQVACFLKLPGATDQPYTYKSLARKINSSGICCFSGMLFYMCLFGERIWQMW